MTNKETADKILTALEARKEKSFKEVCELSGVSMEELKRILFETIALLNKVVIIKEGRNFSLIKI